MKDDMKPNTKTIGDEDLTLLYYGEHEDTGLAARVAESPELSARFERLSRELAAADALLPPQRDEDYGEDVWRRIAPQLGAAETPSTEAGPPWWHSLVQPRFSLAGALGVAMLVAVAFMVGRGSLETGPGTSPLVPEPATAQLASLDGGRLLARTVAGHLEQLDRTLTNFAHQDNPSPHETETAMDLLVQNRLYRRSARDRGDTQLANFLADLEPLLIEIAYEGQHASPASRARMQEELRGGVLFRVRVLNNQLNQDTASL
jgi:hypothetical protein